MRNASLDNLSLTEMLRPLCRAWRASCHAGRPRAIKGLSVGASKVAMVALSTGPVKSRPLAFFKSTTCSPTRVPMRGVAYSRWEEESESSHYSGRNTHMCACIASPNFSPSPTHIIITVTYICGSRENPKGQVLQGKGGVRRVREKAFHPSSLRSLLLKNACSVGTGEAQNC